MNVLIVTITAMFTYSPGAGGVSVCMRGTGFLLRFDKFKVLASKKAWVDIRGGGRFSKMAAIDHGKKNMYSPISSTGLSVDFIF